MNSNPAESEHESEMQIRSQQESNEQLYEQNKIIQRKDLKIMELFDEIKKIRDINSVQVKELE